MAVSPEDVRGIAALARLGLDPAEVQELTRQLNGILEHVDALGAVDLEDEDRIGHRDTGGSPLRADEPGAEPLAFGPEEIAPDWRDGFFVVPRLASHDLDAPDAAVRDAPP